MHQSRYFLIEWDGPAEPYTEWLTTEAAEFLLDGLATSVCRPVQATTPSPSLVGFASIQESMKIVYPAWKV